MKQWHPLFAKLLRPVVEGYYEIQTNVPVGDVPRQVDIVLLRRLIAGDLPLLVEVGLGIHRRMNEDQKKRKSPRVPPADVSFWYLADHLGSRFLRGAQEILGTLEPSGPGVWRCRLLRHLIFLVSGADLPVEARKVCHFHILGRQAA